LYEVHVHEESQRVQSDIRDSLSYRNLLTDGRQGEDADRDRLVPGVVQAVAAKIEREQRPRASGDGRDEEAADGVRKVGQSDDPLRDGQ
jgi:hypothetical protein